MEASFYHPQEHWLNESVVNEIETKEQKKNNKLVSLGLIELPLETASSLRLISCRTKANEYF